MYGTLEEFPIMTPVLNHVRRVFAQLDSAWRRFQPSAMLAAAWKEGGDTVVVGWRLMLRLKSTVPSRKRRWQWQKHHFS